MQYKFFICDVFTIHRFGGNPLAVVLEAQGLSSGQMQQIAREFNFSETSFVLPSDTPLVRQVRIFSPSIEVPFAGHPNIGTAFVLAQAGLFGDIGKGITVTFKEGAGPVPLTVRHDESGRIWAELAAPQALSLGETVDPAEIARGLSLDVDDIETSTHLPQVASVGLPFLFVNVASHDALRRARIDIARLEKLRAAGIVTDVHLYTLSRDEFDIRARMFSPFDGVPEDPATGSANCALVALLTHYGNKESSGTTWRIAQGVEMGRPSYLQARTHREGDVITAWIGGYSVLVAEGHILVN